MVEKRIPETKTTANHLLYVTSNKSYGMESLLSSECFAEESMESATREEPKSKQFDLSFQYSRESDTIGKEIKCSDSVLAQILSQKESLKKLAERKKLRNCVTDKALQSQNSHQNVDIEDILKSYKNQPKQQMPLYTTTSNEYGMKKPSRATYNSKIFPKNQTFSKSFNCIMFKDQGLNTSQTRSNVHGYLDPSFG